MSDYEINWDELSRPFSSDEMEWRVGQCGQGENGVWARLLPYVDARAVMRRLDEVVGPGRWEDKYREVVGSDGGFVCSLSIHVGDGWVTKEGCAGFTHVESVKGGESTALRRAAVKFGIGRYLYALGERWASEIHEGYPPSNQANAILIKDGKKNILAWCLPPNVDNDCLAQTREKAMTLIRDWAGVDRGDERAAILSAVQAAGIEHSKPLDETQWQEVLAWYRKCREEHRSFADAVRPPQQTTDAGDNDGTALFDPARGQKPAGGERSTKQSNSAQPVSADA